MCCRIGYVYSEKIKDMKKDDTQKYVCLGENLSKRYGAVYALRGVDFRINEGEIVGIAGDNGAGKSTLMKLISGDLTPTEGRLIVNNEEVKTLTPGRARELGVEMVYQDLALCDNLDICENIFIGSEIKKRNFLGIKRLDHDEMRNKAQKLFFRLNVSFPSLLEPVTALSGGQRQMVAIARAIAFKPCLMIMDEPTAALSVGASEPVLQLIKMLPSEGAAVMVVSHRLSDLLTTTDRILVIRHGSIVAELKTSETTEEELLHQMAGIQ
jgi:simple sugar transport system ATP-binding protein/D-xylose transport system ATP-binding protein